MLPFFTQQNAFINTLKFSSGPCFSISPAAWDTLPTVTQDCVLWTLIVSSKRRYHLDAKKQRKQENHTVFFLRFFYVLPTSAHPPRNGRSKYFVGRQPTYPFLSIFNGSTHDDALPCHVWFDFRLVQHWSGTTFIFKRSLYIQDELYSKFFLLIIMDSY